MQAPHDSDLAGVFEAIGTPSWELLRGKRIFLTGGTGFVGKWLLATLLYAERRLGLDCHVTVLSRQPDVFRREAPLFAEARQVLLLHGDVRDFAFPKESHDFVIHAATDVVAAADPLSIFDSCVGGTRRVLDFSVRTGASRILLVSSGAMYGRQPVHETGVTEDFEGAPRVGDIRSAYGEGKRVTEWLGAAYSNLSGLDVRIARCFAFVGPYLPLDKHFALGNFLRDAMNNAPIVINGDGRALRTYLYAADMASWLWATLLKGGRNETYNVGGDEIVSIAELAEIVVDSVGSTSKVSILGQSAVGMAPERYVPDIHKATSKLGLTKPLALREAIARTAAWHLALSRTESKSPQEIL